MVSLLIGLDCDTRCLVSITLVYISTVSNMWNGATDHLILIKSHLYNDSSKQHYSWSFYHPPPLHSMPRRPVSFYETRGFVT